jgi:hypothetical protein
MSRIILPLSVYGAFFIFLSRFRCFSGARACSDKHNLLDDGDWEFTSSSVDSHQPDCQCLLILLSTFLTPSYAA